MDVLRKIKPEAVFHQVETSANSACLTAEGDITGNIKDFVLLTKLRLFANDLNVAAEVVDKATSGVRTRFVNVALVEAVDLTLDMIILFARGRHTLSSCSRSKYHRRSLAVAEHEQQYLPPLWLLLQFLYP